MLWSNVCALHRANCTPKTGKEVKGPHIALRGNQGVRSAQYTFEIEA